MLLWLFQAIPKDFKMATFSQISLSVCSLVNAFSNDGDTYVSSPSTMDTIRNNNEAVA